MHRYAICALTLALCAVTPAAGQEDTTIRRGADVLRGILIKPAAPAAAAPSINDRGDLATAWMSPILRNRLSGATTGTPTSFFLYAVNPDAANALTVSIQCYDFEGKALASYSGVLELPPLGYNSWASGNAKNVNSVDNLWCAVSAPARFAAFATSRETGAPDQYVTMIALAR